MANQSENQNVDLAARARALDQQIRWQHQADLKGLFAIYPKDKILKGALLPAALTVGICLLLASVEVSTQAFLEKVVDSSLSILPNLLGFLLGGYTILIGFGDKDLLKSTTTRIGNRSISMFQMLSSIFALTIYLQALTLGVTIVAHFTLAIPLAPKPGLIGSLYELSSTINNIAVPLLLFLLLYSILSLRDMVMNVFGFAQQYHLALMQQRMSDEQKARKAARDNQVP